MANCWVSEYKEAATDEAGNIIQAGKEPGVHQTFTFTGTPGASAAFAEGTRFIRVVADSAGYLAFGASPTAVTATGIPIQANTPEYFGVIQGQKVSVVI